MSRRFVAAFLVQAAVLFAAEWTPFAPPARCAARMSVDGANERIIMFGGTSVYLDGGYFNDVWEIPLDNPGYYPWARVRPSGTPPAARADHCLVYDPVDNRMILFGGASGIGHFLSDVWALNLSPGSENWEQLSPSGTPPAGRAYAYAVYCPKRRSIVVFGGYNGANLGDLWELTLDPLAWHSLTASGAPSARRDGGAFFDPANDRMVIFGGRTSSSFTNELWALSLGVGDEHWQELEQSGTIPSGRAGFASGRADHGAHFYVSCGWDAGTYYGDLYAMDEATRTWARLQVGGAQPVVRRNTCGAYDPVADNFFLFCGEAGAGSYLNDAYFADCPKPGPDTASWQQSGLSGPTLSVTAVSGGEVRIHCLVARAGIVNVAIFDGTGAKVCQVYGGHVSAPGTWLAWDGRDQKGLDVPAGAYYCTLDDGSTVVSRKVVLVR